jgi:adenylate kinase
MKIIMLGAPGAGKGTMASRLHEKLNIPHISTGDIFRENIANGTELGKKAKTYMDKGQLVPDELTCDLVADRIEKSDCNDGFILDGFPRTIPQAEMLDRVLKEKNEKIDHVINIQIKDDTIVKRMDGRRSCPKCKKIYQLNVESLRPKKDGICDDCGTPLVQREDDKPETVLNRLKIYHEQTEPLIDYYKKQDLLQSVNGEDLINVELEEILDILYK